MVEKFHMHLSGFIWTRVNLWKGNIFEETTEIVQYWQNFVISEDFSVSIFSYHCPYVL